MEAPAVHCLVAELTTMADAEIGGTLIIPEDANHLLSTVPKRHHVNEPLTNGALLRIFRKRSKSHDGAVVVDMRSTLEPRIRACQVHLRYEPNFPQYMHDRGTRHNSALYASTTTTALYVVVSEGGEISVFHKGKSFLNISKDDILVRLQNFVGSSVSANEEF